MNVRRMVRIARLGCVLLLPLIVSCGASVKKSNVDPNFTATNFADGGVAILGCTTVVIAESDDLDLSNRYCDVLGKAIKEKQKGVEVEEWANVREAVGDEKILKCLKEFHDSGTLEPATLESLKGPLAGNSRYVLVHRIESDRLKFDMEEERSRVDGEMGSVTTGYVLITERIISMAFSIYDLEDGKRVSEATIESGKGKNHASGISLWNIDDVLSTVMTVDTDLDDIFDDEENPISQFPSPANQEEIVDRIYSRYALQLPASR